MMNPIERSRSESLFALALAAGTGFGMLQARCAPATDPGLDSRPTTVLSSETASGASPPAFTKVRRLENGEFEVTVVAQDGPSWGFESSDDLRTWIPVPGVTVEGSALRTLGTLGDAPSRFFRMRDLTVTPASLNLPVPGGLYPAGTRIGGDLFGIEFTIPALWRGGLRLNSPWMLFSSDAEPGLIVAIIGFVGTGEHLLQDASLRDGFSAEISPGISLFFRARDPFSQGGDGRLSGRYAATGLSGTVYRLNLEFLIHPDGGFLAFLGLTTEANIAGLQNRLLDFIASAKTTARPRHGALLDALPGRSFEWESGGHDWYPGAWPGSASSTNWNGTHAFFCSDGSFEINRESTSYLGTRSRTGWEGTYLSLGYGGTTTEYGQFTVIEHPEHGSLMLLATLAGYQVSPVRLQPDGSLLVGRNLLMPRESFPCDGP